MPNMTIRIGLLWHSINSGNLGVGALSVAHIRILREAAQRAGLSPRFVVIGWVDSRPPYFEHPDIEAVQLRLTDFLRPGGLIAVARQCDIVLDIGAGDSFTDIYGASRIAKMLLAQNIIMLTRRPFVLSPQTIGPFGRSWVRRLALNVMRRAQAVATRDQLSTAFAREMGFRDRLIEGTDVALRLPYEPPAPRGEHGSKRIGINVSGLLFNGGYTRENMFGLTVDYAALIRDVVRYFHEQAGCEIHLISHVMSESRPVEDDRVACEILAAEFPFCILAPVFPDPSAAKSYIAGMDFFTGARMHACIAAFSSGVPVLPMAYSRKFAGFFGALGYDHIADCKSDSHEGILAKLRSAYENRARLKAEAGTAVTKGLERLRTYEDEVGRIMSDFGAGKS